MYICEKMSKNVVYVKPEYLVSKAFQLMIETGHSKLPVIDDNNKLVGIITEKVLAEVNPSKATSLSVYEINHLLSKTKVRDIMRTGVFKINKNSLIEDAALIMKEHKISCLPVVDGENVLVGIISKVDIFKTLISMLGLKSRGTRISIRASEKIGELAEITTIIAKHNINIKNISNFTSKTGKELIIKIDSFKTDDLIEELENKGYEILSINIQN